MSFSQSYASSGEQSRAVEGGLPADVVVERKPDVLQVRRGDGARFARQRCRKGPGLLTHQLHREIGVGNRGVTAVLLAVVADRGRDVDQIVHLDLQRLQRRSAFSASSETSTRSRPARRHGIRREFGADLGRAYDFGLGLCQFHQPQLLLRRDAGEHPHLRGNRLPARVVQPGQFPPVGGAQLAAVRACGVDLLQGYYFGRPLPAAQWAEQLVAREFERLLKDTQRR